MSKTVINPVFEQVQLVDHQLVRCGNIVSPSIRWNVNIENMALCLRFQLSNVRHLHRLYSTKNGSWSANTKKWNTTTTRSSLLLVGGAAATITFIYYNGYQRLVPTVVHAESTKACRNRVNK